MKAQHIPSSWFIGSWVYFHAFFNKASLRLKLHHWIYFEVISLQGLLWFIMPQFIKENQKMQELIEEVWPNWTNSWFLDHKCITLSILNIWSWFFLLWFLIIILKNFYSHAKSYCARKFSKIEKGFQVILVPEELGFWTSKEYILLISWYFWLIPKTSFSSKGYQEITSKVLRSCHEEET